MQVKILKPFLKYSAGTIIPVKCNENGLPVDRFWRKRIKDAEIDNCIEIVKSAELKALDKEKAKANREQKAKFEANQKKAKALKKESEKTETKNSHAEEA